MNSNHIIKRICVWSLIIIFIGWMSYIFSIIHDNFDTDLLWHIKIGQDILARKEIFLENTYSWLDGTIWTQQEWLFDVILYGVVSLFGITGFAFIHFMSQFCFIYFNVMKKHHHFCLLLIFAALLLYICFPFTSLNRPAEYSSMFIVLTIYLYDKTFKLKPALYFLIGMFIANFHCGAAVSMTVLMFLIFSVDVIITKLFKYFGNKHENISNRFMIQYLFCILLYAVGLCINPYGYKQVVNMFCVMDLNSTKYINEWKSFSSDNYIAWILLFVIAYSFGYGLKNNFDRKTIREISVLSALLVLSCVSSKAFVMFYYIYLMYGLTYFDDMIFDMGSKIGFTTDWFSQKFECNMSIQLPKKNIVSSIILILTIFFATFSFVYNNKNMSKFIDSSNIYIDEQAINYLKNTYSDDMRILNGYTTGNYLLYNDIPCFIDTRQQPYAKEFGLNSAVDDYFNTNTCNADEMDAFFERYNFNCVLSNEEYNADEYLSEHCDNWSIVYVNQNHTIKIWKRI